MGYEIALPFDTNDPEFARGVEAGRLWEMLKAEPDEPFEELVHVANAEMAIRIGEALGRAVSSEEHDEHWMTVRYASA